MLTTPPEVEVTLAESAEPSAGFWLESWRRFRKRKLAVVALAFVIALTAIAVTAPMRTSARVPPLRRKTRSAPATPAAITIADAR